MSKMNETPTSKRFASQWDEYVPLIGQVFTEPSCTIPDQSMTIPEIIAKFTRQGLVPGTVRFNDNGGNVAVDPESDPLDDWNDVKASAAAAKAAAGSSEGPSSAPSEEPSQVPAVTE